MTVLSISVPQGIFCNETNNWADLTILNEELETPLENDSEHPS